MTEPMKQENETRRTAIDPRKLGYRERLNATVSYMEWRGILSGWALAVVGYSVFSGGLAAFVLGAVILLALIVVAPAVWPALTPEVQWKPLAVLLSVVLNAGALLVLMSFSVWLLAPAGVMFVSAFFGGHTARKHEEGRNGYQDSRRPKR